ncbi:hypothetical protein HOK51_11105 [Candidatus Woesearchaeota archaeon]|jgi:hypothetical protein|nr:hypothetical protein [Candidatus Woesearchaeota archaeon]MBT6520370.1 hypothetical protein [Candidatus Woesearchaeota archaeon]MBT7368548.1 hypothetical protein [Candidatus Woesearchaeota archaeon]
MKKILIFLVISSMLFAVGCGQNQNADAQASGSGSMFEQTTEALSISFVPGAPPEKILDKEQPFGISIRIENKGSHNIDDINDVKVMLTGFDPADFGVGTSDLEKFSPDPLRGVKIDTEGGRIPGGIATLDFPSSGSVFSHQTELAGQVTYNLKADVCYKYGSIVNTDLCVLEDLIGVSGEENTFCTVTEEKTVDNSGSPVKVSSFRESVASSTKVSFLFKIEHVGSGKLYESGSTCEETFQKRNKVHVKVDTGISDTLTCSGLQNVAASNGVVEGDAILLNGAREISCTQTVTSPSDFKKIVRLDLGYDYKNSVTTSLLVQHVGG